MAHAVVLGGSIAGLASAIDLARRGHTATVIERDPVGDITNGEEAFTKWDRPGVPQFHQGHAFSARARNLLLARIPEVVKDLVSQGIEEFNAFKAIAPPELWEPDDDEFTGLLTRRPALELAVRRVAESEPGVTIRSPAAATKLIADDGRVPHVRGLVLDNGERIEGDVVLDCGGRRSPVAGWLAERGVTLPSRHQDCDASYYSRYFRLKPDTDLPQMMLFALRGDGGGVFLLAFPGDHNAFGITFVIRPDDEELRQLRHTWAWDATAAAFPALTGWIDPAVADPITDVLVMASHRNTRREFVVDGAPLVLGLLPVGDALCTTNPQYGWGASMALTYAFAATEAIDTLHADPQAMAIAYNQGVQAEADAVYRESAAMDRLRMYRLTETPIPDDDRAEMERQELIECVQIGAFRDPVLGRALLRTNGLLDRPDAILDGPDVVASAKNTQRIIAGKPRRKTGPERDELLELLAAANPQAS
jgi:2-polyprenyl-6-methoxyphenol hydroxylase-like FAD-dependent oxidoreductase